MAYPTGARLVAVYESETEAQRAVDAVRRAGAAMGDVRVGEPLDRVASLKGEMREETEHAIAGPGNVGPWTKEMAKGMTLGLVVGGLVGIAVALPFSAIDFGFDWWARALILGISGFVCGATAGWVLGGGFGARRPAEPLAAERGVTLTAPADERIQEILAGTGPIRIDVVEAHGQPVETVATDEGETPGEGIVEDIVDHARQEHRRS